MKFALVPAVTLFFVIFSSAQAADWRAQVSCENNSIRIDERAAAGNRTEYQLVIANTHAIEVLRNDGALNADQIDEKNETILSPLSINTTTTFASYIATAARNEGTLVYKIQPRADRNGGSIYLETSWTMGNPNDATVPAPFSLRIFKGCSFN